MNDVFTIKDLGSFSFVVTLIEIDYPRTFVCKKAGCQSVELFLFDEFNHGTDFVEWICVQISVDDLDRLNRGYITLESCFYGPRKTPKPGYKIISKSNVEIADSLFIDDVSSLIIDNQTYIEPFIEDSHGAGLLSKIYDCPIISLIIKPEKYADPMIETTRITSGSNDFKSMVNALPFAIETRNNRMCFSQTHSLVVYYEINDKKNVSPGQGLIGEEFEKNVETHNAFSAIKTILNSNSTDEQIINAFKGDIKSIEKTNKFISEVKRNNMHNAITIQAVDCSSGSSEKDVSFSNEIDTTVVKSVNQRCQDVVGIISQKDNHLISTFIKTGQFLMLDTTGRKKFKFQSTENDDEGTIYSGFAGTGINGLMVDNGGDKKYTVRIQSDVLQGEFGSSKPIFTLLEIIEIAKSPEQISLI